MWLWHSPWLTHISLSYSQCRHILIPYTRGFSRKNLELRIWRICVISVLYESDDFLQELSSEVKDQAADIVVFLCPLFQNFILLGWTWAAHPQCDRINIKTFNQIWKKYILKEHNLFFMYVFVGIWMRDTDTQVARINIKTMFINIAIFYLLLITGQ